MHFFFRSFFFCLTITTIQFKENKKYLKKICLIEHTEPILFICFRNKTKLVHQHMFVSN
ncbi:hypothetical protein KP509_09G048500 [Ceratopteris richardii]|uniref:Uncharacterized protein n=1 Tax=Ceratopteris richardii TaxID=49495 RepID=A0A8T2U6A1_CERRI|nr:hypothetical protein KP509_24G001700 [Ceratopteris richardii]KAH7429446.1 hypothetical protein KP509_09G048500 [Ceratopteris richardii]